MTTLKQIWDWVYYILFKNVPVFIATVIGIFTLACGLLIYGAVKAPEPINVPDILDYQIEKPAQTFPMKINITDEFSDNQIKIIQKAADDWNKFTKGKVIITLSPNWIPPEMFSEDFYRDYSEKTMWMKTGNEAEVVKLFLKYSIVGDGFTIGNTMVIINQFDKLDPNRLYVVVVHEIGHFLNLQHINKRYPALMNVTGNQGQFTNYDKAEFCYIYKCNYKDL